MSYDTDAQAYITAVEAADGASLPTYIKNAIDAFVVGAKADGFWSAIKAACFLAGPATLAGALVPLVGTAPTNNGPFVSGDYSQTTGIKGGGADSGKYLNSNRANNADPQNDNHNALWVTSADNSGTSSAYIGAGVNGDGSNNFGRSVVAANVFIRNRSAAANSLAFGASEGLMGVDRANSTEYTFRADGSNSSVTRSSQSAISDNVLIFATSGPSFITDARLAWYSIGESLNLANLDTRLTTYMAAIAAGPTSTIQTRRRRDLGGYGL